MAGDGLRASGGCNSTKPYLINLTVGLAMPYLTLSDIFIHEIMHGLFFDAGLGDIHDIQTPEHPRGMTLRTAKDNEYNFNFYINKLMVTTKESMQRKYLMTFRRPLDPGGEAYIGKEDKWVDEKLMQSDEYKVMNPVFKSVKALENWARGN